ncbi:MAG: serine/threonine-protein kinase [Pseudonocardia sp.]
MSGDAFGPYRLEARLGRGAMGEVWRAVDTSQGNRVVALKLLGAWLGGDEDFARRFRNESGLAARLSGPNIIPIHRYGEIDGRLYIDMPLVDGTDLGEIVERDGPLAPERVVRIVEQVADALDTAHRAGMVHRDVKPSNILLTGRPGRDFAYLIDFGLARAMDGARISLSGTVVGTPHYMAPERFDGKGDHRSDVYALACVLHEALTGRRPYEVETLWAHMKAHRETPPPVPSRLVAGLPRGFDDVVARGMAKDPADRHPDAVALADAAREALATPPASSVTVGPVTVVAPLLPPPEPAPPPLSAVRGSIGDRTLTGHTRGVAAVTTAVLGGRPVVVSGSDDATVRVWDLVTGEPVGRPLTGHTDGVLAVAATELDGRAVVASGSSDRTVRLWDLASGGPLGEPLTGHTHYVSALAAVPGAGLVVSGGVDRTIRVWDLARRAPVGEPLAGHEGSVSALAVTSMGGLVVIVSGSSDRTVRVWDLATGAPVGTPMLGHARTVSAVTTAELDGRPVAVTGGDDRTVRVWDLATGAPVGQPLTGHTGYVWAVAVTRLDGRAVIVSGGSDRTVRVWDLATGAPVGDPITGHHSSVAAVTTAELDGRAVVVAGSSTVRVLDLADPQVRSVTG